MTIFEAIREDHKTQRTLVDLLAKTHGDSDGRDELFDRLKTQLQRHAAAEERHFYAPLLKRDLTQDKARHGVAEHQEINALIDELEKTDRSSPGWLAHAKRLREVVHHHLDEEEREIFQLAGKVLDASAQSALAERYRASMQESGA